MKYVILYDSTVIREIDDSCARTLNQQLEAYGDSTEGYSQKHLNELSYWNDRGHWRCTTIYSSFDEAKQVCLQEAKIKLRDAEKRVERARMRLKKVQALKSENH